MSSIFIIKITAPGESTAVDVHPTYYTSRDAAMRAALSMASFALQSVTTNDCATIVDGESVIIVSESCGVYKEYLAQEVFSQEESFVADKII